MSKDLKAQEGGVMGDLYGCSDHNCIFGHQGGMGTNGGCSCEKTLQRDGHQKAARQIRLLRSEVTRLRAEKAALGWRRVEDELPEGAGGVVIVEYGLTTWATAESVRHDPEGITHWLPLPPLPEESKDLKAQEGE